MKYCCDLFGVATINGDLYQDNGFWIMDNDKLPRYFFVADNMWGVVDDYLKEEPMTNKTLCVNLGADCNGVLFGDCPFCGKELKSRANK